MASVNKVILVGHLGRDPETRYLPSGEAITNISLATSESWNDKASGEKKEATEWHRVTFFGRLAEVSGEYLKKGSQVYVEGQLRTRKYQDKETGKDRYSTEIRANRMQMLGGRPSEDDSAPPPGRAAQGSTAGASAKSSPAKKPEGNKHFDDMEDDIPF